MNHWTELVQITAIKFNAGDYPFTIQEFYENSSIDGSVKDSDVVDGMYSGRIAIKIFDYWKIEHEDVDWLNPDNYILSNKDSYVDENRKLSHDTYRLRFQPLDHGFYDRDDYDLHQSLIQWNINQLSLQDVFQDHVDDIIALIERLNKDNKPESHLLTFWHCSSGIGDCAPWDQSDYDETWYLIGAVLPQKDNVQYIPLKDS